MFCKNRTTLIGFIGNDAETRFTSTGLSQTRFSVATNARWKDRESAEYRTRTEWHRIVVWGKLAEWAGSLKKGAFIEVEGELRYREFQPEGSAVKVRTAEIHANSILTLDRAEAAEHNDQGAAAGFNADVDVPF
jgi:single-strand DNA-binding protein